MDIITQLGYFWHYATNQFTTQHSSDIRSKSHPLSKKLRALFERKYTRRRIGITLAMVTFTFALSDPSPAITDYSPPVLEIIHISATTTNLTTNQSVRLPLNTNKLEINQPFHSGHLAIDIDGELGNPVYPFMKGRVLAIRNYPQSYGKHIIIDHGQGLISLYAHLNKISSLKINQEVTINTIIGKVGNTGHSTGPHLHLEIIDQGRRINPLSILAP